MQFYKDISLLGPLGARENGGVVVQCPTCSSKFRIADDKVTDRGVRVRCTSCKNVFQVRKSGVVPAEPPAGAGSTTEMSPLDVAAPPRPPPRATAPPRPAISRPPAARPPPATSQPPPALGKPPAAGNGRGVDTDDLFGMAELTGDAPASRPRTTPTASKPAVKPKPMPNFDDIDLEVDERPAAAKLAAAEAKSKPPAVFDAPPPPLPPSRSGEHVALGAFKTALKDPFEGMDMGEPGTGAIELATQPKKDKLAEAARAEMAARAAKAEAAAPDAPAAAQAVKPAAPPEAEIPPGRAMVSSALTGLLGAALAIAVVIISALSDDAAAGWLGLGPASDIVATRVVSGIYDTASGKQVFYIRGRVENRSQKVRGPFRVTAELIADGNPEGRAEAIAGAEPTPEEVWSLKSPADAEKLTRTLETSAVERKLQPGASLPFFAVIAEPPHDLQNHRLRVRVEAVDAWVAPTQAKVKGK
jgi:predicted Zn finger-like uncharacterized protein